MQQKAFLTKLVIGILLVFGFLVVAPVATGTLTIVHAQESTAEYVAGTTAFACSSAAAGGGWDAGATPFSDFIAQILEYIFGYIQYAEIVDSLKALYEMYKLFKQIWDFLQDIFGLINDEEKAAYDARVAGVRSLWAKKRLAMGQPIIDNMYRDSVAALQAETAGEQVQPTHQHLCHTINLNRIPASAGENTRQIAQWVATSDRELTRGPTTDRSGPAHAAFMEAWRQETFADKRDGYEDNGAEQIKIGPNGITGVDADLTMLAHMDGSITFEKTPVQAVDVKWGNGTRRIAVPVPDRNEGAQMGFLAAFMGCLHLSGYPPTPAWGKAIETPAGATNFAAFEPPALRQDNATNICGELLGYFSRPEQTAQDVIQVQNQKCESAKAFLSPAVITEQFADCKRGLSEYQEEFLRHLNCKTDAFFTAQAGNGASAPQMTELAALCAANWDAWLVSVEMKKGRLIDAILSMQENSKTWPHPPGARAIAQWEQPKVLMPAASMRDRAAMGRAIQPIGVRESTPFGAAASPNRAQ